HTHQAHRLTAVRLTTLRTAQVPHQFGEDPGPPIHAAQRTVRLCYAAMYGRVTRPHITALNRTLSLRSLAGWGLRPTGAIIARERSQRASPRRHRERLLDDTERADRADRAEAYSFFQPTLSQLVPSTVE